MQRARRQALREQRRGGDRSRRHQRARAGAGDAFDEGQKRNGFADARAVQPDEAPRRAGKPGASAPFPDAPGILLAASEPHLQKRPGERRAERGQEPIGVQRQGRRHAVLSFAPGSVAPTMA